MKLRHYILNVIFVQAAKTRVSFAFLTQNGSFAENLPNPVAYISNYKAVLISEPNKNRIGIFDSNTFNFRSWLQHPSITNGTTFKLTSKFLLLKNGHFLILEKDQINILNGNFAPYQQPVKGEFISVFETDDEIPVEQIYRGP